MLWILAADGVAAFHAVYIVFVIVGFAAVLVGAANNWQWVRNPCLRLLHLAAIALVCVEVAVGATCPLTSVETALRLQAGQNGYARDFVGYWFDRFIFHDAPPWVFATTYFGFAVLVLMSFWLAPVRSSRSKRCHQGSSEGRRHG